MSLPKIRSSSPSRTSQPLHGPMQLTGNIMGWSLQAKHSMLEGPPLHTKRCTSPLKPLYTLPSANTNGASEPIHNTSHGHKSPVHSRVVDVSDIPGATARSRYTKAIRHVDTMRDITSPERRVVTERRVMAVNDIEGASPKIYGSRSRTSSSPGRGTLYNGDILGATTGTSHSRRGNPSSYSHEFSSHPRVMMRAVVPPWGEM
jgi:hypothetical protein